MRISQKLPAEEQPSASRQRQRTERTRERLLDAALEVFKEKGYDDASPGLVTARADLGTGTFYLHFRDKRAVYEAMVQRRLGVLRRKWSEERLRLRLDGEPSEEISLMIQVVADSWLADVTYARLLLLDGPPIETWLVADLGRGVSEVIRPRVKDAEFVANLVIGATIAASRWAISRPDAVPGPRAVKAAAVAFCAAGVAASTITPAKKPRKP